MVFQLGAFDTSILILYGLVLVGMGIYFLRETKHQNSLLLPVGVSLPGQLDWQ